MTSQPLVLEASAQPDDSEKLAAQMSSLEVADDQPKIQEAGTPTHRSHDPQFNQKRSDPFQFGSRYLQETDDVFEFNAWDHVETDDTYKEYAEQQYAMQRESPVSDFDKCKSLSSSFISIRRCLSGSTPRI
jgi:tRNAThr (cytosine32-N3)-methyltransferase